MGIKKSKFKKYRESYSKFYKDLENFAKKKVLKLTLMKFVKLLMKVKA